MTPDDMIADLDDALSRDGEDVVLRRMVSGVLQAVTVRAKVTPVSAEQISSGIAQTELNFVLSPTQISDAGWPAGEEQGDPPFDPDPRVPRPSDEIVRQGRLRSISFVDDVWVGGVLVRINGRMAG